MTIFLLTVIDPVVGALLLVLIAGPIQLLVNLLWRGALWLLKVKTRAQRSSVFWWSFAICSVFTLLVAIHNTLGPIKLVRQFRNIYRPSDSMSRFQPEEIILIWLLICLLVTLLYRRK